MLRDVSVVIVIDNDKFLILKRSNLVGGSKGFWNFPGGSVEPGEDFAEAAARELEEEAGITVNVDSIKNVANTKRDDLFIHYFLAKDFAGKVKLNYESSDYKWISPEEADNYLFVGGGNIESKVMNKIRNELE